MGIFESIARPQQCTQEQQLTPDQVRSEVMRIRQDPGAYLQRLGYNIPAGMTDARQITRHLLSTGQVGSPRLQQVMQLLGRR